MFFDGGFFCFMQGAKQGVVDLRADGGYQFLLGSDAGIAKILVHRSCGVLQLFFRQGGVAGEKGIKSLMGWDILVNNNWILFLNQESQSSSPILAAYLPVDFPAVSLSGLEIQVTIDG